MADRTGDGLDRQWTGRVVDKQGQIRQLIGQAGGGQGLLSVASSCVCSAVPWSGGDLALGVEERGSGRT